MNKQVCLGLRQERCKIRLEGIFLKRVPRGSGNASDSRSYASERATIAHRIEWLADFNIRTLSTDLCANPKATSRRPSRCLASSMGRFPSGTPNCITIAENPAASGRRYRQIDRIDNAHEFRDRRSATTPYNSRIPRFVRPPQMRQRCGSSNNPFGCQRNVERRCGSQHLKKHVSRNRLLGAIRSSLQAAVKLSSVRWLTDKDPWRTAIAPVPSRQPNRNNCQLRSL